jgi:XapX domain-containing protein
VRRAFIGGPHWRSPHGAAIKTDRMELYLLSLCAGALIGVIYSAIKVRSPAPPLIALVGLLGMLIGEQAIASVKHLFGF